MNESLQDPCPWVAEKRALLDERVGALTAKFRFEVKVIFHNANELANTQVAQIMDLAPLPPEPLLSAQDKAEWQEFGNCLGVDPDLFFPERGASEREAKEVCRGCIVREECLEYALANNEKFGVWGGMSERERRRLRRNRVASSAVAHINSLINLY